MHARVRQAAREIAQAEGTSFDQAKFDEAVDKASAKVKEILSTANEAASGLGIGNGENATWLAAVESLITAVEAGDAGDAGELQRARILFASFKGIVGKTAGLASALADPVPADLLVTRDFLALERQYLEKQIGLIEARRSLALEALDARMLQAWLIAQINQTKPVVCEKNDCAATPADLEAMLQGEQKQNLYWALAYAWLALGPAQARIDRVPWEKGHLNHVEIGIERERALGETLVLASGAIDDLAAFHKTGLKREEIIALVGRLANLGVLGGILNATD